MKWNENLNNVGTDAPIVPHERREDVRIVRSLDIEYVANGATIKGRISDISVGGLFIDTNNPLEVGTSLQYRFSLPGDDTPLEGLGRVTWTQHMVGMGIQFLNLSPEDRERIKYWVAAEFFGVAHDG